MRVRCKSPWLLHFTAALPVRRLWQLDESTVWDAQKGYMCSQCVVPLMFRSLSCLARKEPGPLPIKS
jgi:hypothetical protein